MFHETGGLLSHKDLEQRARAVGEWLLERPEIHLAALPNLIGVDGNPYVGGLVAHELIHNKKLKYIVIIGLPGSLKTTEGEDCEEIITAADPSVEFTALPYEAMMDVFIDLYGDDNTWPDKGKSGLYGEMSDHYKTELTYLRDREASLKLQGLSVPRLVIKTEALFTIHDRGISTFLDLAKNIRYPEELLVIANVVHPLIQETAWYYREIITKHQHLPFEELHKMVEEDLQLRLQFLPPKVSASTLTVEDMKQSLIRSAARAAPRADILKLNREQNEKNLYIISYLRSHNLYEIYNRQVSLPPEITLDLSDGQIQRMRNESIVLLYLLNNKLNTKSWKIQGNVFVVVGKPARPDSPHNTIYIRLPG